MVDIPIKLMEICKYISNDVCNKNQIDCMDFVFFNGKMDW